MPILDFHVPEATTHVIDPVAHQVVDSILHLLRLRETFDDNIYIDIGYAKPSRTEDNKQRINLKNSRCDVNVQTIYNPANLKWDSVSFHNTQAYGVSRQNRHVNTPVFSDSVADVQLVEHQVPCGLRMTFTLSFKNKEEAYKASTAITSQHHGTAVFNDHDLMYDYPIDMSLAVALMSIYKMRKDIPETSFYKYIESRMTRYLQFQVRNSDIGKESKKQLKELVIRRQQLSCKGLLEFDQESPEIEYVNHTPDRFTLTFNYDIQFTRPETLRLYYPTVVENQLVPNELVPDNPRTYLDTLEGNFASRPIHCLFHNTKVKTYPVIRSPEYEDFTPPKMTGAISYKPFFVGTVLLDGEETHIDLKDLGDAHINPVILDLIRQHGDDIFEYAGLFNITFFVNEVPLSSEGLSFEHDRITLREADPTKRYHFVLYEATNITHLDQKWVRALMQYRWFFPATILRNTDFLVRHKFLEITADHDLLRRIERWMWVGKLDNYIKMMIREGHTTPYIYHFTMTPTQFGDYISNTPSKKDSRFDLYDILMYIGLEAGEFTHKTMPNRYLRSRGGYPILPNKSGFYGFNAPLRVLHGFIDMEQNPYGCHPDADPFKRPRQINSTSFREGGPFPTPILDNHTDLRAPSLDEFNKYIRADQARLENLMVEYEQYFVRNVTPRYFTR